MPRLVTFPINRYISNSIISHGFMFQLLLVGLEVFIWDLREMLYFFDFFVHVLRLISVSSFAQNK